MNKHTINKYIATIKKHTKEQSDLLVGFGVVAVVVVLVLIGMVIARSGEPNIVYQPVNACELLTPDDAQKLFDDDVHRIDTEKPEIANETATSKCSYSRLSQAQTDPDNLVLAAIAVRSGINDEGVSQNKTDFATAKSGQQGTNVKNLGQGAFYNEKLGQLNILDGRKWIILSYGEATAPETNELDKALELADIVLEKD